MNMELKNTSIEKAKLFETNFIKPIYVAASIVSLKEKSLLVYPSLLKAKTAFGPTSLPPFINLVK